MAAAEFDTGGNEGQLKPAAALLAVRKRWCGGAAWNASLRKSIRIVRGRGDIRVLFYPPIRMLSSGGLAALHEIRISRACRAAGRGRVPAAALFPSLET